MAKAAAKAKSAEASPLRIVKLTAENFKRLVAVEITPDGNVVEICGPNEAGKSSIMDVISAALGGEDQVPEMPIRRGETEAFLKVDLGEIAVIKTFKMREDGKTFITKLRVENADGFKASSPQTVINGLLGKYAFDPCEFDRLKMKDKFEAMKAFVPAVDFDKIAKEDDADRAERTVINREVKSLEAQVAAIVIPEGAPTEKVDEDALVNELTAVGEHNGNIEVRKERRAAVAKEAEVLRASAMDSRNRAEALRKQADELDAAATIAEADAVTLDEKLAAAGPLPEPKGAEEIRARLDAAKASNALVDLRTRRDEMEKRLAEAAAKSDALTAAIAKRQADKVTSIAEAKLPVEGLEFGDGVILLNGIPLDQCSAAQRLRTSVAIAMAANPRLRVLRISEGSLLDRNGMKILAEMCEGRGYQAWVEVVSDEPKAGFFIEAGRVRASTPANTDTAEAA